MQYEIIDNGSLTNNIIFHEITNEELKGKYVPHEWIFINYLYRNEIRKDSSLAKKFMIFAAQFYPNYIWIKYDLNNPIDSVILECGINDHTFRASHLNNNQDRKKRALEFGEIVTEFLIRFLNYSLVKCQNQNIIVTAQSNCDKQFENLLYKGYSLQRLKKIGYIELNDNLKYLYPNVDGYFHTLPILPTKHLDFPIEEIIEVANNQYKKVF